MLIDSDDTAVIEKNSYVSSDALEKEIRNHAAEFEAVPSDLDLEFAKKFIEKNGLLVYCENQNDFIAKLNSFLLKNEMHSVFIWEDDMIPFLKSNFDHKIHVERVIDTSKIAISSCESLLADEGNIILNANQNRFRPLDSFPKLHLIIADQRQVKISLEHGVSDYLKKYPDLFPFIIDLAPEEKPARFALNKPVLKSRGTKQIVIFYCDEPFLNL